MIAASENHDERTQKVLELLEKIVVQALRDLITGQLERRYRDPLPKWAKDRIAGATYGEMKDWSINLLEAPRLEDVFQSALVRDFVVLITSRLREEYPELLSDENIQSLEALQSALESGRI